MHGLEMPVLVEGNGRNIEWLTNGFVARENRVVARDVEGKLPVIDVKTNEGMPIKEHGVDGEIVKCIFRTVNRRVWEIVADISKFSTAASNTAQINLTNDVTIYLPLILNRLKYGAFSNRRIDVRS